MTYTEYMDSFDAVKVKNDIVAWIRNWFKENGDGCNAIIGISGGKDSTVVAALCVEALGKDRVLGVKLPCGIQSDIKDANRLIDFLGIESYEINIENAYKDILSRVSSANTGVSKQCRENLPPRIRMATLYAVSQSVNGRVANTCNLSEDWVGYSTRYGDSVGDFSPLSMLTTDEVIAVGKACGLPDELVEKVPADGLCGKTDEDNLGFTYRALNEYIRTGVCDDSVRKIIDRKHVANLFKLQPMPVFRYLPKNFVD